MAVETRCARRIRWPSDSSRSENSTAEAVALEVFNSGSRFETASTLAEPDRRLPRDRLGVEVVEAEPERPGALDLGVALAQVLVARVVAPTVVAGPALHGRG